MHEAVGVVESTALLRVENALVAYARYLGETFWPVKLALPYVNPGQWSWLEIGLAVLVVAGVSLAVLWLGRQRSYLLVGWCWFGGTLVPVIGLTQGWGAFMADRFTYMPSIGVLILAVWGVCDLTRGWRDRVAVLSLAGGAATVLCLALTRQQTGYWRANETLFRHAIEVTQDNYHAHFGLGTGFDQSGQLDQAISHYQEALRLKPDCVAAYNSLGIALDKKGQLNEAICQFQESIRLAPDFPNAHHNLGIALAKKGQLDEAIRQFQEAIRLHPDYTDVHYNLGVVFFQQGRTAEAIRQFQTVIRLKPDHAEAHNNLGSALGLGGHTGEAIREFQVALRLKPDCAAARRNLDLVLGSKTHPSPLPGATTNR